MVSRNSSSNYLNIISGNNGKQVGSIAHAACVLSCLSNNIGSVTEIARQCNLTKSNVHRILQLLEEQQFVAKDTLAHRYYMGPLFKKLTVNPVRAHHYVIMHAYDEMKRLSTISEETIAMDVMVGIRYHSLLEIPSSHDLKVTQEYKKAGPLFNDLYCGASVKVMLSQLSDERLRIAMDIIRITRETKNTVTDKRILMEQLKDIRRKGYAITYSERVEGGMCIAAPVTNYILPIVLCVLGPENRLRPKEKDIIERLITSSSRISASLGNGIKRK